MNRLADETSPYLRQHADNPVDWYPWGEEAFARARAEDMPILLSVGYSACHWCHVMAHESFEDPEIAALMNERFVSVKVDREERPDVDAVYMRAVQALTGSGGWPMTVFLTPDGRPFYGGTYFPPDDRRGMPGFPRVLVAVADAYRDRRDDMLENAERILQHLQREHHVPAAGEASAETLDRAAQALVSQVDRVHGGFGPAPKFPSAMALEYLLRAYARLPDPEILAGLDITLTQMAWGGIYDHLGGGFHRYSTDSRWLVPHFEKMLYDNALLARLYLLAYQATDNPLYRRVAEETLDYVRRDMTSAEGGFYSTQDADSEGEEGRFYVWTPRELDEALGAEAGLFAAYYGVTPGGNFEGRSILSVRESVDAFALAHGIDPAEAEGRLAAGRARLLATRSRRVWPGRDDKALASWNGLMLRAFAEAGFALRRDDYLSTARASADFLLGRMRDGRGRLLHVYKDGQAKVPGMLEDYANVAAGLFALYQATLDRRYLHEARALADQTVALFWHEGDGTFYDTASDHEPLVVRPESLTDNATPSGSAVALDLLVRLQAIAPSPRDVAIARRALVQMEETMGRYPTAFGCLLCDLDLYVVGPTELSLVGDLGAPDTLALLDVVRREYRPRLVVTHKVPGESTPDLPTLEGRDAVGGKATAYVCRGSVCSLPTTSPEELARLLD